MLRMDCEWHLFHHKKVIMEFSQSKLMKGWHSLRFLTTGETFKSLGFQFRISRSSISYIVISVCETLTNHLGNLYLKNTISEWRMDVHSSWISRKIAISECSRSNWWKIYCNYPTPVAPVIAAINILTRLCCYPLLVPITNANVGTNGRTSDSGIWNKSSLLRAIENREIGLPEPRALPYRLEKFPFVILGDDTFALKNYMTKPFPQRNLTIEKIIYNYRRSRPRPISENMFGILANRWRVFQATIHWVLNMLLL